MFDHIFLSLYREELVLPSVFENSRRTARIFLEHMHNCRPLADYQSSNTPTLRQAKILPVHMPPHIPFRYFVVTISYQQQ